VLTLPQSSTKRNNNNNPPVVIQQCLNGTGSISVIAPLTTSTYSLLVYNCSSVPQINLSVTSNQTGPCITQTYQTEQSITALNITFSDSNSCVNSGGLSSGKIAGIVIVCCLIGIIIALAIAVVVYRRLKKRRVYQIEMRNKST